MVCGDHVCTAPYESSANCAVDCGICGDRVCVPGENQSNCPFDCGCPIQGQVDCCNDGTCHPFFVCTKTECSQ